MVMEMRLSQKLAMQLVMTPQLQQAIKLLQLSRMELMDTISQEMVENPVLEENLERPSQNEREQEKLVSEVEGPQVKKNDDHTEEVKGEREGADDIDWESYLSDSSNLSSSYGSTQSSGADDLPSYENFLTRKTSLYDHLIWQLRMADLDDAEEFIGTWVIGNLNEDGYLNVKENPLEEVAAEARAHFDDDELDVEYVEGVLKVIQRFDPIGTASRDLRECLLVQAEFLELNNEKLIIRIIEDHLKNLERRNYPAIQRDLKQPMEKILQAVKIITQMEPKPGRPFITEDAHYIIPDIYIHKVGDEFVIVLNEDGIPKLRISNFYRNAIAGKTAQGKTKEYIQEKLRSGVWLIRSIYQRQRTIYKVTESILKFQRAFFEMGVAHLKPMILKDVAEDIGMHESTISRVTTNKYVHTPQGIFELKYFFNSSISRSDGGEDMASEAVKEKIRQIVGEENPKKPYSDQKIVELLKSQNIDIARRTVAKYREMMHILSSSKRKRLY